MNPKHKVTVCQSARYSNCHYIAVNDAGQETARCLQTPAGKSCLLLCEAVLAHSLFGAYIVLCLCARMSVSKAFFPKAQAGMSYPCEGRLGLGPEADSRLNVRTCQAKEI